MVKQHAALLSLLAALMHSCPSLLSAGQQHGSPATSTVPRTIQSTDLFAALADSSVGTIELTSDIIMRQSDWGSWQGQLPLAITRNFTIRSAPQLGRPAMLDFGYLTNQVQLMPGLEFKAENVIILNFRSGSTRTAPGIDFFAKSPAPPPGQPRPILLVVRCFVVYRLCFSGAVQVVATSTMRRPPELPGAQLYANAPPQEDCSPSPSAPLPEHCWVLRTHNIDIAAEGMNLDAVGMPSPTYYIIQLLDTYGLCPRLVNNACLHEQSALTCFTQAWDQMEREDAATAAGQDDSAGLPLAQAAPAPLALQAPHGNDLAAARPAAAAVATAGQGGAGASGGTGDATEGGSDGGGDDSGDGGVPLYVVLPAALGGAALAAALAGAAVWLLKRRQRRTCKGSDPPSLKHRTSSTSSGRPGPCGQPGAGAGASAGAWREGEEEGAAAGLGPCHCTEGRPADVSIDIGFAAGDHLCPALPPAAAAQSRPAAASWPRGHAGKLLLLAGGMSGRTHDNSRDGSSPPESTRQAPLTQRSPFCAHVRLDLRWGADVVVDNTAQRGAGAFGRVLEGCYEGQRVAVKVLHLAPRQRVAPQEAIAGLRQEVEVLGRCSHPNVVSVLGACLEQPHLCLVMELMDQSLEQLLKSDQHPDHRLPMQQALGIAMDVATGLAYLHPTVVHRDLKPANVLLDAASTAKLSDFGLARLRETVCATAHPEAGTAPYMAPECFDPQNNCITHKADIYSFAVLLWQLLSGAAPWQGRSPLAIAFGVTMEGRRLPLAQIPAGRSPQKLLDLLVECWDLDPLRRPSAEEVVKRLAMVKQGLQRAAAATAGAAAPPSPIWTIAAASSGLEEEPAAPAPPSGGSSSSGNKRALQQLGAAAASAAPKQQAPPAIELLRMRLEAQEMAAMELLPAAASLRGEGACKGSGAPEEVQRQAKGDTEPPSVLGAPRHHTPSAARPSGAECATPFPTYHTADNQALMLQLRQQQQPRGSMVFDGSPAAAGAPFRCASSPTVQIVLQQ